MRPGSLDARSNRSDTVDGGDGVGERPVDQSPLREVTGADHDIRSHHDIGAGIRRGDQVGEAGGHRADENQCARQESHPEQHRHAGGEQAAPAGDDGTHRGTPHGQCPSG
jgi:hypothetical protein